MALDTGLKAYIRLVTRNRSNADTMWLSKGKWTDGQAFTGRIRYLSDGDALKSEVQTTRGKEEFEWCGRYTDEGEQIVKWESESGTGAKACGSLSENTKDPNLFQCDIRTWRKDPQLFSRLREIIKRESDDRLRVTIERRIDDRWKTELNAVFYPVTG